MYFKLTLPVSALNKPDGFFTRSEFKTPFFSCRWCITCRWITMLSRLSFSMTPWTSHWHSQISYWPDPNLLCLWNFQLKVKAFRVHHTLQPPFPPLMDVTPKDAQPFMLICKRHHFEIDDKVFYVLSYFLSVFALFAFVKGVCFKGFLITCSF